MLCQAAMAEAEGEAERSVSLLGVERERLISELGESTGQARALREGLAEAQLRVRGNIIGHARKNM